MVASDVISDIGTSQRNCPLPAGVTWGNGAEQTLDNPTTCRRDPAHIGT